MNDNKTPHKANEYDTKILQTIPFYDEFHRQVIDIVKQKNTVSSWLDIGCGTGRLEKMIRQEFSHVCITAIDPSEQMLKEAKKNTGTEKIKFICESSERINFEKEFDVITAIQVHHYLNEKDREKATRKCFHALKNDGYYISFENVVPDTPKMTEYELYRWKKYQMDHGKTEDKAYEHIKRCGKNYFPITMEKHIELLKKVGFNQVYVFWKSYMQMGILGVK